MRLILPPTINFLSPDEAHDRPEVLERIAKLGTARLEPGFTLKETVDDARYRFYAECNVNSPQLWDVFEALSQDLADPVGCVIGVREEKPKMLPYLPREKLMPVLRLFKRELAFDPFVEFGLIHQTGEPTEEVFIPHAKYLKVWGPDANRFRERMAAIELTEIPNLAFVDEFPRTSVRLTEFEPTAMTAWDAIDEIVERVHDLANTLE